MAVSLTDIRVSASGFGRDTVNLAGQGQSPGVSVQIRMSKADNFLRVQLPKNNSLRTLSAFFSTLVELRLHGE